MVHRRGRVQRRQQTHAALVRTGRPIAAADGRAVRERSIARAPRLLQALGIGRPGGVGCLLAGHLAAQRRNRGHDGPMSLLAYVVDVIEQFTRFVAQVPKAVGTVEFLGGACRPGGDLEIALLQELPPQGELLAGHFLIAAQSGPC